MISVRVVHPPCADALMGGQHCTNEPIPMHDTELLWDAEIIMSYESITLQATDQSNCVCVCADWLAGFDPLWGVSGYLQRFCDEPPDRLLDHIRRVLRDQPAHLRLMLMDRLSPAFAELLTSKMEERAAQDNGATPYCHLDNYKILQLS